MPFAGEGTGSPDHGRGGHELDELLAGLDPVLHPGRYVFATVAQPARSDVTAAATPGGCDDWVAMVREDEGTTVVVPQDVADRAGMPYEYAAAMITLRVHSALDSVGLTAAVSSALAAAGISCNVVAGARHDHLFVPAGRGGEAVAVLMGLARRPAGN